jgi:hypothetical protein
VTRTVEREIVSSVTRMMDGLLDAEHAAFDELDSGLQRTADATRERIVAADRVSRAKLMRAQILPDDPWLTDLLMPPISNLVALARERALTVVARQLRAVASVVGPSADRAVAAGVAEARMLAPRIEHIVVDDAMTTGMATVAQVRAAILAQRRMWAARHEPLDALIARVCSAERVGLPGAHRGAVWALRGALHATARAASVNTANAVLLAGMRGWNHAAATA